jgi:hypothetical protein
MHHFQPARCARTEILACQRFVNAKPGFRAFGSRDHYEVNILNGVSAAAYAAISLK